ncbi:MAG: biotin synthase BioB [Bacteroidales bacterium]|nr:biotin synthase BioB [Bacteroidales bacterium]
MSELIDKLKEKVLLGGDITAEEAYLLLDDPDKEGLLEGAAEITRQCCDGAYDTCSIINARSGNCSEDCKWCAQSRHSHTDVDTYPVVERGPLMSLAKHNDLKGVKRFSLVTSGRAMRGSDLRKVCSHFKALGHETELLLCASMGLLRREELQQLWDAGVRRYHCNLETAPSYFPELCSTHTIDDKLATIRAAKEIGFEVCSGGIIGMGESRRQRVEFALTLREVEPASIPINILSPIPGTPLEGVALISDEEILETVAIFRMVHPRVQLRFAGGRARLSSATQQRALEVGINGAIVGDLLTTIGNTIDQDRALALRVGYRL